MEMTQKVVCSGNDRAQESFLLNIEGYGKMALTIMEAEKTWNRKATA